MPTTGNGLQQLGSKMRELGLQLSAWHRTEFNKQQTEMKVIQEKLRDLMRQPHSVRAYEEQKLLHVQYSQLLSSQEKYWKQRSRALWLKEGDRNTAYFHRKASNRRSRDMIRGLLDENDVWQVEPQEIKRLLSSYCQGIFSADQVNVESLETVVAAVPRKVTDEMNHALLASYTNEEIKKAIFQMHPSKSPGPDEDECVRYRLILDTYEQASGQQVNFRKSSVVFSNNVQEARQHHLATILGVNCVKEHDKYLGLPIRVGRSKTDIFAYIKERLTKKLVNWKAKILSSAGKEILIKAVAQTMPLYAMNCYLLPKTLCDDIHQLCASFFWGDTDDKKKIHRRSWEKLCLTKLEGGMGFKNIFAYNLAMLGKQGWRILSNPQSLIARLYKAKYFPTCSFWEAEVGESPSFSWRSILSARPLLKAGVQWCIGDETQVSIWNDRWVPECPQYLIQKPQDCVFELVTSDLIDENARQWIP
ncbi:uncharacterized protein LOC133731216 [Rosa rugosa]|uniref:uncharacterized protein LOC133731216 n=1 Tax=Rosa rugosa TaxID=74645 RepID=UPI002B4057F9|nr:uncharacterized protein LOC133731216 [Rosa rugosa]